MRNIESEKFQNEIVGRYRKVAGAIDNLFLTIRPRTAFEVWRIDGIGSCSIWAKASEEVFIGPAKEKLISLRNRVNPNAYDVFEKCGYHDDNTGCTLKDLKSPLCLSHIEAPWELKKRFKINGYDLWNDIEWILKNILLSDPENCNSFVQDSIEAITQMTKHVETFPKLTNEEQWPMMGRRKKTL